MINKDFLRSQILDFIKKNQIGSINMSYQDFCENVGILSKMLGDKALLMFSENTAAISFYKWDKIRFIITKPDNFQRADFLTIQGIVFNIVGNGMFNGERFVYRIWRDIFDNRKVIIFISIIYSILYFKVSFAGLEKMNNYLMNIINIFIASFFVLIGILYSDKNKNTNLFKKGLFDRFMRTDLYILKLSFGALLLCIISNSVISLEGVGKILTKLCYRTIDFSKYNFLKYYFAAFLTYISITFIIICFDSIINYYIKKIRSNYFVDAFEELLSSDKNTDD